MGFLVNLNAAALCLSIETIKRRVEFQISRNGNKIDGYDSPRIPFHSRKFEFCRCIEQLCAVANDNILMKVDSSSGLLFI